MLKTLELEIMCFECDEKMIFIEYSIEEFPVMECPQCHKKIILELKQSH